MNLLSAILATAVLPIIGSAPAASVQALEPIPGKPNVLIIYIDDMGYAQPGCYGGTLAPTPHMDAIAAAGVRFTDGYVSACVCSPSRVGLLTGRYQARSGHDANSEGRGAEQRGLSLDEVTIAQRMKAAGYATGIIGKWHVGSTSAEYLPGARGFDEAYGSAGNLGGHDGGFYRGVELIPEPPEAPVTSPLYARESIAFIERNHGRPWFLYLSFNAVHSPNVASAAVMERFAHLPPRDQAYAALISEADDAIGAVMAKLRDMNLEERTLVFCLSDNGGASTLADMGGFRGRKWLVWEGGIRVPWMVQWKGRIPGGLVLSDPVIQLDILPTALAAAGADGGAGPVLDGVNLLPLLEGRVAALDPRVLYWRFGVQHAVRQGEWKLVKASQDMVPMLIHLPSDPGEQTDRTPDHPDKARALQALFDAWNASMTPPRWEDRRWVDGNIAHQEQKKARREAERGRPATGEPARRPERRRPAD